MPSSPPAGKTALPSKKRAADPSFSFHPMSFHRSVIETLGDSSVESQGRITTVLMVLTMLASLEFQLNSGLCMTLSNGTAWHAEVQVAVESFRSGGRSSVPSWSPNPLTDRPHPSTQPSSLPLCTSLSQDIFGRPQDPSGPAQAHCLRRSLICVGEISSVDNP